MDSSRRSFLRLGGLAGLGVASASLLAACGGSSPGSNPSPGPSRAATRGGSLSFGINAANATPLLDPYAIESSRDGFVQTLFRSGIIENSLRADPDFVVQPLLAESLEPNADGSEWTLRLKEGVEFHHGKTLAAEDVIFSIERLREPSLGATAAPGFASVTGMKAMDDRTVRFTLAVPMSGFYYALVEPTAGFIPVDFDPAKPAFTGPFKVGRVTPESEMVWERFENYHGEAALLDEIVVKSLPDPDARVNALLAKQVGLVEALPAALVGSVEADGSLSVLNLPSGRFDVISMRVDAGPTQDVRVRQALRLCIDREQVLQVAKGGFGQVGNDIYGRYDPAWDDSLVRTRDVAEAKRLIEEADADGAEITLTTMAAQAPACQVLAKNAEEIGIKITVDVVDPGTMWSTYPTWPMGSMWWPASFYLSQATIFDGPESGAVSETGFNDEEFNAELAAAQASMDEAARIEHLKKMQAIQFERGGNIIATFDNTISAHDATLVGWPTNDASGHEVLRALSKVGYAS